ncbi:hypothetical protein MNAN1_002348 [Malassezia nana]|uniref:Uncharacterized protein n=1 Tax=Malassezia nana TaxID=180528 RepID=A0AAF0J2U1_9BASI|nr:hypothetical protein MNAN1_002348 [Malassezia nana]
MHAVDACLKSAGSAPSPLHTHLPAATQELKTELLRIYADEESPVHNKLWSNAASLYLDMAEATRGDEARWIFANLAVLALPPGHDDPRILATGLRILSECCENDTRPGEARKVFASLVRMSKPDAKDTARAIRHLVLKNRLSDALYMIDWHIRQHWNHGAAPPSRGIMHTVMIQMKTVEQVLRLRPPPKPGRFVATPELYAEYTMALSILGNLLSENYLPLVPAHKEDITWLVKHLTHFYTLDYDVPSTSDAQASIYRTMPQFLHRLPCGRDPRSVSTTSRTSVPQPSCQADRAEFFLPVLSERTYNVLVQYALRHEEQPQWCRLVLEHMMHERNPPIVPDDVTANILLQQANKRHMHDLALLALEWGASSLSPDEPSVPAKMSSQRLLAHLDDALREENLFRVEGLIYHFVQSWLQCHERPEGVPAVQVLWRLYPQLRQRQTPSARIAWDPRILTASLYLAARSNSRGLTLHMWRLIKDHCETTQQKIAPESATVLMKKQVQSNEKRQDERVQQLCRIALQEYAWLMEHWSKHAHHPPAHMKLPIVDLWMMSMH